MVVTEEQIRWWEFVDLSQLLQDSSFKEESQAVSRWNRDLSDNGECTEVLQDVV